MFASVVCFETLDALMLFYGMEQELMINYAIFIDGGHR